MPRKLKRFLLRYDPPGIGLEVAQEDGSVDVVHKDLPAGPLVQSIEAIVLEVDRIIEEDDLLTKKRHKPALIQLLGRLYQVDVPSCDEEESPPAKAKAANPVVQDEQDDKEAMLQEGSTVVLVGLRGDQSVHNGELGILTKCRHEKRKYEASLTMGGAVVKVKGLEHLILTAPKGTSLAVGTAVVIRGLRNHTELNGCFGRVVECLEETHRYEVRATESGQLFRVKQENLVPIEACSMPATIAKENREPNTNLSPRGPKKEASASAAADPMGTLPPSGADDEDVLEVGSQVLLTGLKSAMTFNGQSAEVLSVDKVRSRYEIKLQDGSVKTIRSENLKLLSRPSKTSPRNPRRKDLPKAVDRGK